MNQTIGLKSVSIAGNKRATKKRVFTEDEYNFLKTRSIDDLKARIGRGYQLIGLMYNPAMLNMTQKQADAITSNLRYQIDEIQKIINNRSVYHG